MKKPKTSRFDPKKKQRIKPENLAMPDLPEIKPYEKGRPGDKTESKKESKHDRMKSSYHDSKHDIYHDIKVEDIRRVVKTTGKEATIIRLTQEEKRRLSDIAYSFKRQEIKSSENEVVRIALNALLDEHKENGKDSLLSRVIAALNA